jgi:hypothetical protein
MSVVCGCACAVVCVCVCTGGGAVGRVSGAAVASVATIGAVGRAGGGGSLGGRGVAHAHLLSLLHGLVLHGVGKLDADRLLHALGLCAVECRDGRLGLPPRVKPHEAHSAALARDLVCVSCACAECV